MEGGRFNHSWCMGVVGDGYGGLDGAWDGGGGWHACGKKPGVGRMSGETGALTECEVMH